MNGSFRRSRTVALTGAFAALSPVGAAWSQTAPPFAQLLNQTRDVPRVLALEADVARARGLALQARARPKTNTAGTHRSAHHERYASTIIGQVAKPV